MPTGASSLAAAQYAERYARTLFDLVRIDHDIGYFRRYSGVVSGIALIVIILVVQFTVNPSSREALMLFPAEMAMALVVGFGYGTLRLMPIISATRAVLGKGEPG